jgi:hypothetical protein
VPVPVVPRGACCGPEPHGRTVLIEGENRRKGLSREYER